MIGMNLNIFSLINSSLAPPFKAGFEKKPTPLPQNLGNFINLKIKFPKF